MHHQDKSEGIVEVVLDKYSSAILTATCAGPIVVDELVEMVGMSSATAYRRIGKLLECDLLEERTQVDEGGTQYHVYEANFQIINLEIVNGLAYLHVVGDESQDFISVWDFR